LSVQTWAWYLKARYSGAAFPNGKAANKKAFPQTKGHGKALR